MKKLILAVPVLLVVVLVAAMVSSPKAATSPVEVDVPLSSLQQQ